MRLPARSATDVIDPTGAAYRNVDPPKPSASTSTASTLPSTSRSRPVMPRSSVPAATYVAMSRGRRK
jgi:hypothetical protein